MDWKRRQRLPDNRMFPGKKERVDIGTRLIMLERNELTPSLIVCNGCVFVGCRKYEPLPRDAGLNLLGTAGETPFFELFYQVAGVRAVCITRTGCSGFARPQGGTPFTNSTCRWPASRRRSSMAAVFRDHRTCGRRWTSRWTPSLPA